MSTTILGDAVVRFGAETSGLTAGINTAKSALTGLAETGPVGAVTAGLAGVGIVAAGVGVVTTKMAGDFQQNITKLFTTAGEFKSNLQSVGDGILGMSASVGTSALKLSQAMYWIESGGLHGAQGLEALRIAAQAAKAENANLDQVSIALAASLNAYKGSGMSAVQVMNTLTAATGQGMMTFEQLSGSLASVLPASAKFHISLNNVTAALATMTAQGDPASNAATHLRQMILALEAPSKIGASALKSVGLTSQQVSDEMKRSLPTALQMITDAVGKKFPEGSQAYKDAIKNIAGGSKQMMGFLELTGSHMHTFADNVGIISGAVKKGGNDLMGWSDIQGNFNFKVDAAKASVEALAIGIGMQLLPVATKVVGAVAPIITSFDDWVTKSDYVGNAINDLTALGGGIGTFATGIIDAADKSGAFQSAIQAVVDILPSASEFLLGIGTDINTNILPPLESLITNVGQTVVGFSDWMDKGGGAKTMLGYLGGVIRDGSKDLGTFVGWMAQFVGWMNKGGPATDAVKVAVVAVGVAFAAVKVVEFGKSIFDTMTNVTKDVDKFLTKLGDIKSAAGSVVDFFKNTFGPKTSGALGDVETSAGKTSKATAGIGTAATDSEAKVATATGLEDTQIKGVGTAAATTSGEVTGIGTAATTSETKVAAATTLEDVELKGVGTSAGIAEADIVAMGPAAAGAGVSVAGSFAAVGASMIGSAIAAIVGIEAYMLQDALPAVWRSWWDFGNPSGYKPPTGAGGVSPARHASGIKNSPTTHVALVGEQGPEVMVVPQGADIYPSGTSPSSNVYPSTMAIAPSQGNNGRQEIHLNLKLQIDGQELSYTMVDHLGQAIVDRIRAEGPVAA